jgi:peptidylprolyl isomerase
MAMPDMPILRRHLLTLALAAVLALPVAAHAQRIDDPENTLVMELKDGGRVVIAMRPDLAPKHVARIKELVRKGFYDGIVFHRVIRGFMAQTGDPTGTGTGGSGQKLNAEFSREPHKRGTVSMARAQNPNSADSQFFICFEDAPFLDGQYTVWGKVTSGMEAVDRIKKGAPGSGQVTDPDKIIRLRVAADIK